VYSLLVQHADKNGRAKIDRELEQAGVRHEIAMQMAQAPRRRAPVTKVKPPEGAKVRPPRRAPDAPPTPSPARRRRRTPDMAPPGFDQASIDAGAKAVSDFLQRTKDA
jgi:hypothetical protein